MSKFEDFLHEYFLLFNADEKYEYGTCVHAYRAGAAAMAELFASGQNVDHRCEWTTTTGERCELWKNHGDTHAWQIHRGF